MTWMLLRSQLAKQKPFEWQRMHGLIVTLKIGKHCITLLLKTSPMRDPSGKIHSSVLEILTTCRSSVFNAGVLLEGSIGEVEDGTRHGGRMSLKH